MPRSTRDIIAELVTRYEPVVQSAFLAAVDEIRNNVILKEVVTRLERGDIAGALDALHIDREAFARVELAIAEAYNSGGQATVENLLRLTDPQGNRVRFLFGVRNTPGEAWLREHSAALVTRIVEDQRTAIQTALVEGLSQGRNPRRTALDIVGRVNRASNRREGGIVGLTSPQSAFVAKAREQLLSGDAEAMRAYLERGRRDKRFDRTVLKAIREGKPVPAETVDRMTSRYADKLLQLRGETIAQNETMTALARSREDAIQQQIDNGKIEAASVTKVWRSLPQEHPRLHHRAMNGKSVGWNEQFTLPNGVVMSYPHASDAPASETLFCKCTYSVLVDYFASVERRYRARTAA